MNRPPTIDTPRDHHLVLPLLLDRPEVPVWVVARDEDGDDLAFFWFVDDSPVADVSTTASGDNFVSSATLYAEDDLDGAELRCIVSDGNFEDDVEILWLVEAP